VGLPAKAHAYLDPGTGSYVIQIIIATLAGGTYVVITSWGKIKTFFNNIVSKFSKNQKDEKEK
jgi:hypothetical protein